MKKKLLKNTLVVATIVAATTAVAGYERYQQNVFAAANPLFEENLDALSDQTSSSSSGSNYYDPNVKKSGICYTIQTKSYYKCIFIANSIRGLVSLKKGDIYESNNDFGYTDSVRYERRDKYCGSCSNDEMANYRGCQSIDWTYCESRGCPVARTYMDNYEWDQYNCQ